MKIISSPPVVTSEEENPYTSPRQGVIIQQRPQVGQFPRGVLADEGKK